MNFGFVGHIGKPFFRTPIRRSEMNIHAKATAHTGTSKLKSNAVTMSPWKSAWKARVNPQPGHAMPVNANSGQTGKICAFEGSNTATIVEPAARAHAPASADILVMADGFSNASTFISLYN